MSSGGLIDFESSWKKSEAREALREARETILEKAKEKADRRRDREDREKSWMLKDLEERLRENKKAKKKRHKKEKKKKVKKEKKSKKKKKDTSSSENSDSDEEEWVEKVDTKQADDERDVKEEKPPAVKRDSWMEMGTSRQEMREEQKETDFGAFGLTKAEMSRGGKRETEKQRERREEEERKQAVQRRRELNPNLRGGDSDSKPSSSSSSSKRIGDGGASWLRRAFKRAEEQARAQGKTIEEVAEQRWGSIENFNRMLAKAEGKDEREISRRSPDRHSSSARPSSWKTSGRRERERAEEDERRRERKERERKERRRRSPSSSSSSSQSEREESRRPKETSASPVRRDEVSEPVVTMTDTEMNAMGAKIIKAEMLGNDVLAAKLKKKLELAKAAKARGETKTEATSSREEVVVLTRTDSKGMTRPVNAGGEEAAGGSGSGRRRKKERVETHDKDGKRARYFADDDRYDLKTLFEREKLSTAEDQNAMMARLAGRQVERTDEEYDLDDVITTRAARKDVRSDETRDRDKAIAEHQKERRILEDCMRCVGARNHKKHLMIALGKTCYLSVPDHASLTDGHCLIVPVGHSKCGTLLDEDVVAEMEQFKAALVRMFAAEGEDAVFFESALHLRHGPHMVLECVPLPEEAGHTAPMFFQKAIQECEGEWAHNKKLITLSRERGLRRSVPKGLPYFHVSFGTDEGFAHVVEDEQDFPGNFAQEIIGGMLDLEPRLWRNPKRDGFEAQKAKVLAFGAKWKDFDFTRSADRRRRESSSSSSSSSSEEN